MSREKIAREILQIGYEGSNLDTLNEFDKDGLLLIADYIIQREIESRIDEAKRIENLISKFPIFGSFNKDVCSDRINQLEHQREERG